VSAAKSDQPERPPDDHEPQGTNHHGLDQQGFDLDEEGPIRPKEQGQRLGVALLGVALLAGLHCRELGPEPMSLSFRRP